MSYMFAGCKELTSVNLSSFNTKKVISFKNMFYNDISLLNIDLSNFDTSNTNSIQYMFYKCQSLTSLDLSNFDTSHVGSFSGMFAYCSNLTYIDISNFSTQSLYDKDTFNIFLERNPNGTVVYNSLLFNEEDLIKEIFGNWEKIDINENIFNL